jgi:hypothetical protein
MRSDRPALICRLLLSFRLSGSVSAARRRLRISDAQCPPSSHALLASRRQTGAPRAWFTHLTARVSMYSDQSVRMRSRAVRRTHADDPRRIELAFVVLMFRRRRAAEHTTRSWIWMGSWACGALGTPCSIRRGDLTVPPRNDTIHRIVAARGERELKPRRFRDRRLGSPLEVSPYALRASAAATVPHALTTRRRKMTGHTQALSFHRPGCGREHVYSSVPHARLRPTLTARQYKSVTARSSQWPRTRCTFRPERGS